ncbi:ABC transporter substrate-binding protein [Ornithinimicrobium cavernae]|uniref:ABC transporter substrate-binding protein n=1 Tax=Ornithinimicrobium cavernae TaxID=2666047 RepID=UPI000D69E25D|nr:ABC transporter substrate-binding protein [Ornithinimicrobium cavernae]
MSRTPSTLLSALPLTLAVTTALTLAACSDPAPPRSDQAAAPRGSDKATGTGGSEASGSMITTTWDLEPVDSVVELLPEGMRGATLTNAVYNDFPPQEFLEGDTLVGIQPDMALALSEVMGLTLENSGSANFDSIIPGLMSGRYDIASADFGVTDDRLEQVDFVSQFAIGTGFAVVSGSDIAVTEPTDLCGHSVGVQAGSYYIDQLEAANQGCLDGGLEEIGIQTFPNDGARTLALTNGRIDVTATNEDVLAFQIASDNLDIEVQDLVYEPVEQAIALPDESPLGPALEAAMKEIIDNGTYQDIMDKWGVGHLAYESTDRVVYYTDPSEAP